MIGMTIYIGNEHKSQLKIYGNQCLEENLQQELKKALEICFDDFHDNVIEKYPKFVKSLKNIGTIQSKKLGFIENYEPMITPAEHAKENRWNPDGVAFMYLACGKREDKFDEIINLPQKTCFEEIRLENGSEVIICEFKPIIKNAKLINLYYEEMKTPQRSQEIFMSYLKK